LPNATDAPQSVGSFVWADETGVGVPPAIAELLQRNFDSGANFRNGHTWRQCRVRKIHSLRIKAEQQNPRHELSPCFGDSLGGTVATMFAGVCETTFTDFSDSTTVIGYTYIGPDKQAIAIKFRIVGNPETESISLSLSWRLCAG
jgi:hypothetical protein